MARDAIFPTIFPPFTDLLKRQGTVADDFRFVARNFLLDENVLETRARTYGGYGAVDGFADRADWVDAHEGYLGEEVFSERPANGPPRTLDPANRRRCPETFRHDDNFVVYGGVNKDLDLLRVLSARSLASRAGRPEQEIVEAGREMIRARAAKREPDARQKQVFDGALGKWNKACDLRPCFATFYATHEDLLKARPDDDMAGWADELRDRLGLAHLDPRARGEISILVFRYAVRDVPKRKLSRLKPLAVPSVLDGRMSPAFCPAPNGVGYGHTIHLAGSALRPWREVVHPYLDFRAEHLFRVGMVKKPVPQDLLPARKAHLLALREMAGRDDYAAATDPEV